MTWNSHPFVPEKILSPPCVPAHLRPLIKLAGNLIRNYSLKRKFCCPEQIIKCCEGAKATFIRAQKEGGGEIWRSEKGLPAHLYLFIYIFTLAWKTVNVSWDTKEKDFQFHNHNALTQIMRSEANHVKWTQLSIDFSALLIFLLHWLRNNCTWRIFPIITLEDNSAYIAFSTICLTAAHHRMI